MIRTDRHGHDLDRQRLTGFDLWRLPAARPRIDALPAGAEERSGASTAAPRAGFAALRAPRPGWRWLFTGWLWGHFALSSWLVMSGRTYPGFVLFGIWMGVVVLARVRR